MIEAPRVLAYEPNFDRLAYQSKEADRDKLKSYTKRQIETHLGERFNVLLSTTRYEARDGQIFAQNSDEPFINSLIRGRNYRRLNGNPLDFEREDAEVVGFSKIEQSLASDKANVGDMMLSVSPSGVEESIYRHNFYDIFTLKEDEKGKFVEARRYSSGLSIDETTEKLREVGFLASDLSPRAEDYLSNPIKITKSEEFSSSEEVHKLLHKGHEYVDNEDFEKAKLLIASLVVSYVESLANDPFNTNDHNSKLNATLNGMDVAMDIVQNNESRLSQVDVSEVFKDRRYIQMLSSKPVRQVMTGCGFSGGFGVSAAKDLMNSSFSVADKDPKKSSEKQILCCTCPFCNKQVEAEIGGGQITCPNCKKSASWKN